MHQLSLADVNHSEKSLTLALVQVSQMLGLYHAELARILHIKCKDIGDLVSANKYIPRDSQQWQYAEQFIYVYELLYIYADGDEVKIYNWLRRQQATLGATPLYMMVDEQRIDEVINWLSQQSRNIAD